MWDWLQLTCCESSSSPAEDELFVTAAEEQLVAKQTMVGTKSLTEIDDADADVEAIAIAIATGTATAANDAGDDDSLSVVDEVPSMLQDKLLKDKNNNSSINNSHNINNNDNNNNNSAGQPRDYSTSSISYLFTDDEFDYRTSQIDDDDDDDEDEDEDDDDDDG